MALFSVNLRTVLLKAIVLFIPITLVFSGLLWHVRLVDREHRIKAITQAECNRLEMVAGSFGHALGETVGDIRFLTSLNQTLEMLERPSPNARDRLEYLFATLSAQTGLYDQIRLLDARGREIVRVNFNNGSPAPVLVSELQDKSGRYYFKETIALKSGEIYISPLDLNVEQGEVERPLKPMLRLGMPVYTRDGRCLGALVLNVLAKVILDSMESRLQGNHGALMLMNEEGYWLKGIQEDDAWGFMLEERKKNNFARRFPDVWEKALWREHTQQVTRDGVFCTRQISPRAVMPLVHDDVEVRQNPSWDRLWIMASQLSMKQLQASMPSAWRLALIEVLCLLLTATGSFLLALLHERLRKVHTDLQGQYAELESTKEKLRQRESFYRALFENNLAMLCLVDPDNGVVRQVNQALAAFYGVAREKCHGMRLEDVDTQPREDLFRVLTRAVQVNCTRAFFTHKAKGGMHRELDCFLGPVEHEGERLLFCIMHDITEQRMAERALKERDELLRIISDSAQDAIIMVDQDGSTMFWNPAAERMFGFTYDEVKGQVLHDILVPYGEREAAHAGFQEFKRTGKGTVVNNLAELNALRKGGDSFPVELSVTPVSLQGTFGAVAFIRDITDRKKMQAELRRMATTDSLTGVDNRWQFMQHAERELARIKRHGGAMALLMLDVDHFKLVNDSYGHQAGDVVLQRVARICVHSLRAEDHCGRIGGEEFALILSQTTETGAMVAAERIRRSVLEDRVEYEDDIISVTVSIGVTMADSGSESVGDLLKAADNAMYAAKAKGRNCVVLHSMG